MGRVTLWLALLAIWLGAMGCGALGSGGSGTITESTGDAATTVPPTVTTASGGAPVGSLAPLPIAPGQYVFPVSPASSVSYADVHHDYPATDIFAPCGTDAVAVTSGVVEEVSRTDVWNAATDDPAVRGGLSVSIVGDDGVRYYYSHFRDIDPRVLSGVRVLPGEVIAHVGQTGNAAGLGCHVHFGLSPDCGPGDWEVRRGILYPWPYLDSWQAGGLESPVAAVGAWLAANPSRCANLG